jgi:outer membrane protein W
MGKANADSDLNLKTGNLSSLSLGYGFINTLTVWLSVGSAQHRNKSANDTKTSYVNFELGLQYKFRSQSRLQPYGKLSIGVYTLSEKNSDVTKIGNGFALVAGADYFFSSHFGFGAEVNYRFVDFTEESRKVGNDEYKTFDLDPALNGDSVSFMVTFTIQ